MLISDSDRIQKASREVLNLWLDKSIGIISLPRYHKIMTAFVELREALRDVLGEDELT